MNFASKIVILLAFEDAIVGIGYLVYRDWARAVYWLTAAVLCASTVFIK